MERGGGGKGWYKERDGEAIGQKDKRTDKVHTEKENMTETVFKIRLYFSRQHYSRIYCL